MTSISLRSVNAGTGLRSHTAIYIRATSQAPGPGARLALWFTKSRPHHDAFSDMGERYVGRDDKTRISARVDRENASEATRRGQHHEPSVWCFVTGPYAEG